MSRSQDTKLPPPAIRPYIAPILIILLAFALRIYRLDAQALNGDEAFSLVNWTRASLNYLFNTLALIDPQPPAALLSLYGWVRLVGESEFAARSLSMLTSTLTVAISYGLGHRLGGKKAALTTALLCTINPFQIWHAQDLRPYSLWITTSALSAYFFLAAFSKPSKIHRWVAYILAATASTYTFYLEAFQIAAQNVYFATQTWRRSTLLLPWIASQAGITLLLSPWFLRPELLHSNYQPTAGPPDIPAAIQSLTWGDTLPASLRQTSPLLNNAPSNAALLALALITIGLLVIWLTSSRKTSTFLTAYSLIPILSLSLLALGTGKGYFRPRYIGASSLTFTLITALFLTATTSTKYTSHNIKKAIPLMLTTSIVTLNMLTLYHYYHDPDFSKSPNWRTIVQALHSQTSSNDIVIFNYPDPAFTYYFRGPAAYTFLPETSNPPQDVANDTIDALAPQYDYIWFIPVYASSWDGKQVIANSLNTQTQLISEQWIDHTHLYQYAPWEASADEITTITNITFGNLATLEGYRLTPTTNTWAPGTTIYLQIFWRPLRQYPRELKIFTHLLGPTQQDGSPLWSQDDHLPQNAHTSTQTWPPGVLLRDVCTLTLPTQLTPGTYTVAIGFYDPITGQRFPLDSSIQQPEPNAATLITFTTPNAP